MGMGLGGGGGGSGKRRRRRRGVMSEINVTPMVDVMLVLLIIFMVSAPLLTVGVPIDLPQTQATSLDQLNVTTAGVVIAALPLFLLLLVFQKQLVRGLTAGAVKG